MVAGAVWQASRFRLLAGLADIRVEERVAGAQRKPERREQMAALAVAGSSSSLRTSRM